MLQKKEKLVNLSYILIVLLIFFLVFKYLIGYILPFLIAFIFALAMRPVALFMNKKWHLNYKFSAVICLIVFFILLGSVIALLITRLTSFIIEIVSRIPSLYLNILEPWFQNLLISVEELTTKISPELAESISKASPELLSNITSTVGSVSVKVVAWVSGFVSKLPTFLLSTVICIIATFMMLLAFSEFTSFILRQFPEKPRNITKETMLRFKNVLIRFGVGYLLIMIITFSEIFLGLLIIRQSNAALISGVIAVIDILPIVGSGICLLPWCIFSFISGATVKGFELLAIYVIVVFVRQIIEPKIIGDNVGLHPLITLFTMYIGTKLFGAVGLFGLPISCAIIASLNDSGIIHLIKKVQPDEDQTVALDEGEEIITPKINLV